MAKTLLVELWEDFVSLFYPCYCVACSEGLVKGEELICTYCMAQMPQTDYHIHIQNSLKQRLANRIPLKFAMVLFKFSKDGRVQHLLHALKYKNHPEIGVMLGKLYGEKMKEVGLYQMFDLIIPVPLHPSRKRKRGYNQSAKFAEGLSEKLNVPYSDKEIIRAIKTDTQTRKTKLKRWNNVEEIFRSNSNEIVGKRILLVDDVITTGATIEACAQVLLTSGCAELSIACIAEA